MNRDERNAAILHAAVLCAGAVPFVVLGLLTSWRLSVGVLLASSLIAGVWFVCTEPR